MRNLSKLITTIGLTSLLSVLPLAAQVGNGVKFTAPFPFHVGDSKMPSGTYFLTQPEDLSFEIAIVRSADGLRSALVDVNPTESYQPPRQSKVIFKKYGDNLYLSRVIVQGDDFGMAAQPAKSEKKAAEMASAVEERSVDAYGK